MFIRSICYFLLMSLGASLLAQEPPGPERESSVEELAASAMQSVVVVSFTGRDGKQAGLGAGFVIADSGLIATNYHVLGEARPIRVELADGRTFDVTSIEASDRRLDLAIIKINADKLPPALPLGDSDTLKQGAPIVALGNPQGLKRSVVAGVVSGRRELDGRSMIQLAVPIEKGNSGGPVLDMQGRVHGIVTAKSLVTDNLGFAVEINDLKPLLAKPNPIPISRWLTIGALSPKQWEVVSTAKWRRQSGVIVVSEPGAGFGGRALCLWKQDPPDRPYEVGVHVRLDNESGAAGLVFHSDGGDRHYGFYPSAGKLRLSCFQGANVLSWQVLQNEPHKAYEPGGWNYLKVRIEKDRFLCYVNDELVFESKDAKLKSGQVGLAKFRDTIAQFKGFHVARELPRVTLDPATAKQVAKQLKTLPPLAELSSDSLDPFTENAPVGAAVLRRQANELRAQAEAQERLALDLLTRGVTNELRQLAKQGDKFDLLRAALLLSKLDNEDLDVGYYEDQVLEMAKEIQTDLAKEATAKEKLQALNRYLFEENGFHGGRTNYYHKANSYLDQVIEDREGLPITLSVLYMELGRRLGLVIEGVALPGHFIVKHVDGDNEQLVDVFDEGKLITSEEAATIVANFSGRKMTEDDTHAAPVASIVIRMLHNLTGAAQRDDNKEAMLRYAEAMVAIEADSVQHRGMRAILRSETGRKAQALSDLDWIIDQKPPGLDLEAIQQMRSAFERR